MGCEANVGKNSKSRADLACWPDLVEKIFIELLAEEVQSETWLKATITKKGLKRVGKKLAHKTNQNYSYSQLRNKFNHLRIHYQDFCKLLKEPGIIWDAPRNNLTATYAVWKSYRKANKNTRRFLEKDAPCSMSWSLEVIFRENNRLDPQTANYLNAEGADTEYGLSDASRSASPDKATNCKDHPSVDVGCSQKRSPTPDSHSQEKKKARMASTELAEIRVPSMESGKKWTEPTEMRVLSGNPESAGFPITKCAKCLESIEGVDSNSYLQAIKMFKDADWREMFMAMSAQKRLDWLASLN